jgi:hypothetical protein
MKVIPKIISGGQAEEDRAAWTGFIAQSPLRWLVSERAEAEGCAIDPKYPLRESSSASYRERDAFCKGEIGS